MLIQNTSNTPTQSATPSSAPAVTPNAPPITQATAAPAAPTAAQLQSAVQNTNQAMQDAGKSLAFSVDEATRETVVKLVDTQTDKVIGQFPSKQMLAISQAIGLMQEQLQQASISKASVQTAPGLLIKQTA